MSRDFAYKGRVGKGAVNTRRKKTLQLSTQLLIVVIGFVLVALTFAWLSSGKRQPAEDSEPAIQESVIDSIEPQSEDNSIKQQTTPDRRDSPELPERSIADERKVPKQTAEPDQEKSKSFRQLEQILEDLTSDELEFYRILSEPLEDDYSPDSLPEEQVSYRVESGLIRNRVNARSLKALLVFEGYSDTRVAEVEWNGQTWYRLIIDPVESRSRVSRVRDFLSRHDIDSIYHKDK